MSKIDRNISSSISISTLATFAKIWSWRIWTIIGNSCYV